MGATGLVEMIIALRALRDGHTPVTVNLHNPDEDFREWVSVGHRSVSANKMALLTNAGFSGINAALVIAREKTK
jgi:3-oxoacyl-[acyl-carrier-protein] synthase II